MKKNVLEIERMDDLLKEIYGIKNIQEIVFHDIITTPKANEQFTLLPCLYVKYDGKSIELTAKEKYFDVLVKKVYEVYKKEKDDVVKDPKFGMFSNHKGIVIDEKTREILDSGELLKVNDLYKFYENKKSYESSLSYQKDELRLLLPIFEHHVKDLFDRTNLVINFGDSDISGYRNHFTITAKVNGLDDTLMISYEKASNSEYYMTVRSRSEAFEPIVMRLSFGVGSIKVDTRMHEYKLSSSDTYQVDLNGINHIKSIIVGDDLVNYYDEELEEKENPLENVANLDSDIKLRWFKLPWNAYYGFHNDIKELNELESVISCTNRYLGVVDNNFLMQENTAVVYNRKRTTETRKCDVVLEEERKRVTGINRNGVYVIETYFDDDSVLCKTGYYDTYLRGRYY